EVLQSFTEFLVEGGVHGLFPCGSIGEFSSMTREERATVIETVVDSAGGRPVIAGCGGTAVGDVLDYIDDAADAGADAAVVVTPYYLTTTDAGMLDFYDAVAADSALPIVLYNIPPLTKHSLDVETVAEMADREAFVGIKDSSGNINYINELVAAVPDDFAVVPGVSALQVAALDGGADGAVTGVANIFPAALSAIHDAHRAGDRDRAVELLNDVAIPLAGAITSMPTASAIKYLVRVAGFDVGPPLPPLPELTDGQSSTLKQRYEQALDANRVEATR
ncbi:MAG: dihydrodipicolinate synthase family protein, partial [Halobacteriales archaeon]|nr:dihydrodipicolinate synthase family protein [Halobacteriales archaeon]